MEVIETANEGLRRELNVIVPEADLEQPTNKKLAEIGSTVRIPGFRAGKVPLSVLRRRFWGSVRDSVLQEVLNDSIERVMTERGLDPVQQPIVELTRFEDGSDLEFKLTVDLKPEISPLDYSSIELERLVADVPEEEVEQQLEELAKSNPEYTAVQDRAAEQGDMVEFKYLVEFEGVVIADGTQNVQNMILDKSNTASELIENMIGAKEEETVKFEGYWPPGADPEDSDSKLCSYTIEVKQVKVAQPPEVNDALAKKNGLDDVDELRNHVRNRLDEHYKNASKHVIRTNLFEWIGREVDFEVPRSLLDKQIEMIKFSMRQGVESESEDVQDQDASESEAVIDDSGKEERIAQLAKRQTRRNLLMLEIASKEEIVPAEEEVTNYIRNFTQSNPQMLNSNLASDPQIREQFRYQLIEEKVVDYVCELATVTERRVTPEEVAKEIEQMLTDKDEIDLMDLQPLSALDSGFKARHTDD